MKIIGFLLMTIAILLAIAVIATFPNSLLRSLDQIQKDKIFGISYFIGEMMPDLLAVLIIIFMMKKGLRLIK
jgi:hypothetical protein